MRQTKTIILCAIAASFSMPFSGFSQDGSADEFVNTNALSGTNWLNIETPNYFYGMVGITKQNPKRNLHILGVDPTGIINSPYPFASDAAGIRIEYAQSNSLFNGQMPAAFSTLEIPSLTDITIRTTWDLLAKNDRFSIDNIQGGNVFEYLTVAADGDIGFNKSNPESSLHIYRTEEQSAGIWLQGSGGLLEIKTVLNSGYGGPLSQKGDIMMRTLGNAKNIIFNTGSSTPEDFAVNETFIFSTNNDVLMRIQDNGKVGIGTTRLDDCTDCNDFNLFVSRGIRTEKVKVDLAVANSWDWPDYVFGSDYELRSLTEVEEFISANKHLPEVPSAKEVSENGLDLAKMDAVLLKKIEELTLYLLKMDKQNQLLRERIQELETSN